MLDQIFEFNLIISTIKKKKKKMSLINIPKKNLIEEKSLTLSICALE